MNITLKKIFANKSNRVLSFILIVAMVITAVFSYFEYQERKEQERFESLVENVMIMTEVADYYINNNQQEP